MYIPGISIWVQEQSLQPGSGVQQENKFNIGQYYDVIESSALPYYYHLFLHWQHQKLVFT